MYYSNIIHCDIANGTGCRETLFVSGCRRKCPGCFNIIAQNFMSGKPFDENTRHKFLKGTDKPWVDGITILGGEPLEPENQNTVYTILSEFKQRHPDKTVWVYTGFTYEELIDKYDTFVIRGILKLTDVLVDGPFIQEQKNIQLEYRGSSNQRLIDLKAMRKTGSTDVILRTIDHASDNHVQEDVK